MCVKPDAEAERLQDLAAELDAGCERRRVDVAAAPIVCGLIHSCERAISGFGRYHATFSKRIRPPAQTVSNVYSSPSMNSSTLTSRHVAHLRQRGLELGPVVEPVACRPSPRPRSA